MVSSGPEIHDVTDILLGASPAKKATPVPPAKMYSPAAGRVKKIPAASSTVQALPSSSVQVNFSSFFTGGIFHLVLNHKSITMNCQVYIDEHFFKITPEFMIIC